MAKKIFNESEKPFKDINLRFINILDELKNRNEISTYKELAVELNENGQGIRDIKAAQKSLSVHTLRLLKSIYPGINLDYIVIGGDAEMFINPAEEKESPNMEYLINKIAEQAEEIGRLKAELCKKKKSVLDADSERIANAG